MTPCPVYFYRKCGRSGDEEKQERDVSCSHKDVARDKSSRIPKAGTGSISSFQLKYSRADTHFFLRSMHERYGISVLMCMYLRSQLSRFFLFFLDALFYHETQIMPCLPLLPPTPPATILLFVRSACWEWSVFYSPCASGSC